ncbi:MAG: response regulator, partial [Bacteroidales bacterium]
MNERLMILDDKDSIAKIITSYLKDIYEVVWFDNPLIALKWLREGYEVDLIILDLKMPLMRGDEFLGNLKSDEKLKKIPVVILSSEDSTTERINLLEKGAVDYIVKPFNPMEL